VTIEKTTTSALRVLSEERCWELIEPHTVGRLATAITNHPDVFPVNFGVHDKTIVLRTAEGTKLASAVLGTSVAFEVDDLNEARQTGWSVVVKGTAAEPARLDDYLEAVDLGIEPWVPGTKDRYIVVTPTSITGREIRLTSI